MAQKFRNKDDLEIVAPSDLVTATTGMKELSSRRKRRAGFYVDSEPKVNDELFASIQAAAAPKPRRRRAS